MGARGIGRPSRPLAAWAIRLGCSLLLALQCLDASAAAAFGLDDVAKRARDIASRPYKAPPDRLPPELRDLD